MAAVITQAHDLRVAYSNSELEASKRNIACQNQMFELKRFVDHEQAFKQQAIAEYHKLNSDTTHDAEIMKRDLEEAHAQLRYLMDLNKEVMKTL